MTDQDITLRAALAAFPALILADLNAQDADREYCGNTYTELAELSVIAGEHFAKAWARMQGARTSTEPTEGGT